MNGSSRIVLTIPPKAEHVSLARLTVSGVASQCAFDIDVIEDMKVCVSEILNQVIAADAAGEEPLHIAFQCDGTALNIHIGAEGLQGGHLFAGEEDVFALAILDTLMDEVDLSGTGVDAVRLSKTMGRAQADD